MNKVIYRRTLDLAVPGVQHTIYAKRGDALSREIAITLKSGGTSYVIAEGVRAFLYALTGDATIFVECEIVGNTIIVPVSTNMLTANETRLEVRLTDNEGVILTTPQIAVASEDNLYSDDVIEAKDDFSALLQAITAAENSRIIGMSAEGSVLTITYADGQTVSVELDITVEGGDGVSFEPGNALELTKDGVLNVKTTDVVNKTSSLPLTSKGAAEMEEAIRKDFPSMPDVPVKSVNGKTGDVKLSAADVGARASNWMPTAAQVGALPSGTPIPAKTSDLTNDSGFITKLVSDLSNYYSKNQTLTKTEINALISAIPKFAISVVTSLPTSNISSTTVYLVKSGTGSDLYTEYIYVNGAWEPLGSQKVDLTGYATEAWVNGKLEDYLTESQLQTAINTALAQAKASGEFDGADGTVWHYGTAISGTGESIIYPLNTAKGGDYYLNTNTGYVYIAVDPDLRAASQWKHIGTLKGAPGTEGTSPTVTVTSITGGHRITITDKNGTKDVDVMDGGKGDPGSPGRGITSVTRTSGNGSAGTTDTYTIKYTDNTTSTFTVYNGKNGTNGTSVTVTNVSESTADGGSNVVTFSDGKTLTVKNGSKGEDYSFNPTGYGLPVLYITGNTTGMTKDNEVTLSYKCEDKDGNMKTGSCTMKWQGSSSIAYEKKNYTIKFDNAFEVVSGWGSQKKYCLKANYIDHSHARNVVSAKLWGQIVKSRKNVDSRLSTLPNAGAVDGFPVVIVLNEEFHGLYTWNIPKDGWMFGMSDGTTQQAVICADKYTDATDFKALAELDGSDYKLEYCATTDTSWVKTSFNRMLQAVIDSNGSDIDTTLAKYIDIDSAIDYMIDTVLVEASDCISKNTLFATYDGVKWFFSAYDRDSTFGLHWHGKDFSGLSSTPTFTIWASGNKLMNLLWTYKREAIRARYAEIRAGAMSEYNVAKTFWNFGCLIPKRILLADVEKWTSIPSTSVNDIHQILTQYRLRCMLADEWIKDTNGEEETPTSGYTNLVPTSIDTDGSVFNGKGYQDEKRLNSSGAVTDQANSTVTGFIPAKKGDIFRIAGVYFGHSSTAVVYGYIALYKADKTKITSASCDTIYTTPSNYNFSVTPMRTTGRVQPTDVTEINFTNSGEDLAFVRFSSALADGVSNVAPLSGADMIVTRNEEIT